MDEYYRILESLPPALRTPLAKLDAHYAPHIQEIRLRLGQPVQFTIRGRLCPAAKFLPGTGLPAALETDTLRDCFLQLCRRSVYAYEDELKQGYFTVQGGCRIGVAGCRGPGGFSAVTSLNLRIARWVTCPLPPALDEAVAARAGGLLLAGPPGSGKTTLLRSIVQRLCESDALVSVIDERGELMACETGSLPRAAQIRCDVYARCTKPEGIAMALRCMNPQILVCDELGTAENAVAYLPGRDSTKAVLLGANFDGAGQCGPLLMAGAYNNASGVATMLQTAAWLAKADELPCDVIFAAFNTEDNRENGSTALANELEGRYEQLRMLNLKCLGWQGHPLTVYGTSANANLRNSLAGGLGLQYADRDLGADEKAFYGEKMSAVVLFQDVCLNDPAANVVLNSTRDTAENLDFALLDTTAQQLAAWVIERGDEPLNSYVVYW